jgi:TatD DNase family protein
LIDSHCHLADDVFDGDLAEVIGRARAGGVRSALCVLDATSDDEQTRAARIAELWPAVRFAIGVHPHQAGRCADNPEDAAHLVERALKQQPLARAIGEIGLDYHYDFAPRTVQDAVFRQQVRLAKASNRPIVIHTREADIDTLRVIREEGGGVVRGVFHCFTGDQTLADAALALGFSLSFSGIVTFPRAGDLRDIARRVPADRYLVETDSPFLAPPPHRGKRNEPAWVAGVVKVVAEVRGESVEAVATQSAANFEALFAT